MKSKYISGFISFVSDMEEGQILAVLDRMNTWWDDPGSVPISLKKAEYRRRDFYPFRECVLAPPQNRRIITLRGPRQVGKTTLCGQIVADLLALNFPADTILYINIENNSIITNTDGIIDESLQVYENHVLERSFREVEAPIFVFIDEIQKAEGWAEVLKYYTDTYSNILFVCTGSVSTLIREDATETLVGRIEDRIMMPMKFVDVLEYSDTLDDVEIAEESTTLRSALEQSVNNGDADELTTALAGFYGRISEEMPKLRSQEEEYLLKGGYPGVLDSSYTDAYSNLDRDLRYTVVGDLANVFDVQKENKLLKILNLVAESTTGKINVQNIADTAGIDRDTVERYLEHLEEFFLISRCHRYTTSEYQSKGREKVYLQDVGLYNTLQGTLAESTLQQGDKMGPILETAIADHVRRLQFYLSGHHNAEISYWDKVNEVDFVISGSDYVLPIEVKNGDSTQADLRGLDRLIDESDAEFGIAVNRTGELKKEGNVVHIPACVFMFMC